MGLIKNMLMAGALGAAQKGNMASQWFMESPENDSRLHVMFPPTMNPNMYETDADNALASEHIETMHRVHTRFAQGEGFMEAAGLAGLGGVAAMANNRRNRRSQRSNAPHIATTYTHMYPGTAVGDAIEPGEYRHGI